MLNPFADVGTCQKIIDRKIKMKTGGRIDRITSTGVKFEDGTELSADIIAIATGYATITITSDGVTTDGFLASMTRGFQSGRCWVMSLALTLRLSGDSTKKAS